MLLSASSVASSVGSIAAMSLSLLDFTFQNQVTRYWLSSGLSSSIAIIPVISSITTTPKLKTSAFVVILPVTASNHIDIGTAKKTKSAKLATGATTTAIRDFVELFLSTSIELEPLVGTDEPPEEVLFFPEGLELELNREFPSNKSFIEGRLKCGKGGEMLLLLKSNTSKDFKPAQLCGIGPERLLEPSPIPTKALHKDHFQTMIQQALMDSSPDQEIQEATRLLEHREPPVGFDRRGWIHNHKLVSDVIVATTSIGPLIFSPDWSFNQSIFSIESLKLPGIAPERRFMDSNKTSNDDIFPKNSGKGPAKLQFMRSLGKDQPVVEFRGLPSSANTSKFTSPLKKSEGMVSKLL
nr:hypothetical protein Iba_scaffold33555CG0010 [Ipomoea batatas]GMD92057.1 hypothetical protein Iba_chr14eCG5430 [Ipomoea batatas]